MAVSVAGLYDALVEAGAPKDQARRAAEAVISRHEAEHQLATKADRAAQTAARCAEMLSMKAGIIKWNVGTILAAVGLAIAIVELLGS
jgi:hypothetical protein